MFCYAYALKVLTKDHVILKAFNLFIAVGVF